MVSLLTLDMMGNALFIFQRPSYFDLQEELLTGDTKVVDATPDIPPERILMDCGTEGILAGKMVIYPDDDLQDTSRYVPLPSLSMAKECEDYIKEFCPQESDLEAYGLTFTDDFEHDFFNFEGRLAYEREKSYIIKAYGYLDEKVDSFALGRRRREYRLALAKKWCDLHGIQYENTDGI